MVQNARKEKVLLVKTINRDPTPERRTAASYLIGYLKDPNEIITLLTKHISDPDYGVRRGTPPLQSPPPGPSRSCAA